MRSPIQETNIPHILGGTLPREYEAVLEKRDAVAAELASLDTYAATLRNIARAAGVRLDRLVPPEVEPEGEAP